jgi:superfamily I DNA/RNA helicase
MKFRYWIHDSRAELEEMATIGFGKYGPYSKEDEVKSKLKYDPFLKGKAGLNVNDPSVDPSYWDWLHKKSQEDPQFKGTFYDDAGNPIQDPKQLVGQRAADQPFIDPTSEKWFLAKVLSREGLKNMRAQVGDHVAMAKRPDGKWYLIDQMGRQEIVFPSGIQSMVQSVKGKDGNAIQANTPEELFAIAGDVIGNQEGERDPNKIAPQRITPYQRNVEEAFLANDAPMVLPALAGSGKTTMLRHLATFKKPNERWLYLVFNKKNQIEAKTPKVDESTGASTSLFPKGVDIMTTHAFLGRLLREAPRDLLPNSANNALPKKGESPRQPKQLDLMSLDEYPDKLLGKAKYVINKLAELGKRYALSVEDEDIDDKMFDVMERQNISGDIVPVTMSEGEARKIGAKVIQHAIELMWYGMPHNAQNEELNMKRDHDDTMWYAAMHADELNWRQFRYNVILADEVQDFNRCQHVMLQKLGETGARIICVGDKHQAIYGFMGAESDSFDQLQGAYGEDGGGSTLPLPQNFRSGRAIIDWANANTKMAELPEEERLVSGLDFDGEVNEGQEWSDALDVLTEEWRQNNRKTAQTTAILARGNDTLASTAVDLMERNIDFVLLGRDMAQELNKHLDEVVRTSAATSGKKHFMINWDIGQPGSDPMDPRLEVGGQFMAELNKYAYAAEEKWEHIAARQEDLKQIELMTTAFESIVNYLHQQGYHDQSSDMDVANLKDLRNFIKVRFAGMNLNDENEHKKFQQRDPRSYVTLSTAHRSKGMEYERVYIRRPETFAGNQGMNEEQLEQEQNAYYVAVTRAMQSLNVLANEKV